MKKLSNTEAELKKALLIKKACISIGLNFPSDYKIMFCSLLWMKHFTSFIKQI